MQNHTDRPNTQPKTQRGGYRPRSGSSKGAWVTNIIGKAFYLQSSYEIRMAVLLNKAKILWERPESLPYTLNEKYHRYYPDFLLPEYQLYLDTKNDYLVSIDALKIEAVRLQTKIQLYVVRDKEITGAYLANILSIPALKEISVLKEDLINYITVKKAKQRKPRKEKASKMPPIEILKKLIWEKPLTDIAEQFNVGDTAVQKWLSKHKIDKPPHGYWIRRQNGWSHEESLTAWPKGKGVERKFTDEQILSIRTRIKEGEKLAPLAREYNVCHKTMRDIRDGSRYKHLL